MGKNAEINIIPASLEYYDEYFQIRSEPSNLYWTGYDKPPDYQKFYTWYKDRINDNNRHIYLMFKCDQCVGSLNIDYQNNSAAIGYNILEKFEGKGLGTLLVNEAIKKITKQAKEKPGFYIYAYIHPQNKGSIKVIKKNNFEKTNELYKIRFGKKELFYEFGLKIT
jgi:RimJ/RimL family protein N-acetyltransferase